MTLKIIGAGFGRTGTHSLKTAFELLGFGPCHHMYEIRRTPRLIEQWTAVSQGHVPNWPEIFEGYNSQADWPAACHWKELAEFYPEAKVILTIRDPNSWYESILKTILPATEFGRFNDISADGRAASGIIFKCVLENIFEGKLSVRSHAISVFNKHIQQVVDTISADRLLVYDVKDGWDPLCKFLEVESPSQQFPATNTTKDFLERKGFLKHLTA